MRGIPTEILSDILSRLPVKDIIRVRCVSNRWCALIDSHHFIFNYHLYRSLQTSSNYSLILTNRHSLFLSVPLDTVFFDKKSLLLLPSSSSDSENLFLLSSSSSVAPLDSKVVASANGLLLMGNHKVNRKLGVCNLFTREYLELPSSLCYTRLSGHVLLEEYGFAYDSLNHDYIVVRVNQFRRCLGGGGGLKVVNEVEVYSLKRNAWRRAECSSTLLFAFEYRRFGGVFCCGSLHWVGQQMLGPNPHKRVILGFDIRAEKFRFVPLPPLDFLPYSMRVESLKERLCLSCCLRGDDGYSDLWVMRDYGVVGSWFKLLSIATNNRLIRPLAYSASGNEILLNIDGGSLVVYDMANDSEMRLLPGYDSSFDFEICVENLIPLRNYGKKKSMLLPKQQQGKQHTSSTASFRSFLSKKLFPFITRA